MRTIEQASQSQWRAAGGGSAETLKLPKGSVPEGALMRESSLLPVAPPGGTYHATGEDFNTEEVSVHAEHVKHFRQQSWLKKAFIRRPLSDSRVGV